jgi:hypothetical protein
MILCFYTASTHCGPTIALEAVTRCARSGRRLRLEYEQYARVIA